MSFARYLSNKYGKQLLNITAETRLDALKTASEKVVNKAAEATGEFIGKKIMHKIVKPKPLSDENVRDIEQIIIPPEKREEILNELRRLL